MQGASLFHVELLRTRINQFRRLSDRTNKYFIDFNNHLVFSEGESLNKLSLPLSSIIKTFFYFKFLLDIFVRENTRGGYSIKFACSTDSFLIKAATTQKDETPPGSVQELFYIQLYNN